MPNHVQNIVKAENITKLPLFIEKYGKRCFDFNKLIPIPNDKNDSCDWCCTNWGTKWNAYENEEYDINTIGFLTAWSNPKPVMLKLSKLYPDLIIEHWWADEDMGNNSGHRIYKMGSIARENCHDFCSNEAYDTYVKCWGESPCLYQDSNGLWQHRNCDDCDGCSLLF